MKMKRIEESENWDEASPKTVKLPKKKKREKEDDHDYDYYHDHNN